MVYLRQHSSVLLLFIVILFPVGKTGNAQELSEDASISVITASPGNELYTVFGHTAIRVRDPANQLDLVYNYGTFNFNAPGFVWKFVRGDLRYYLSRSDFNLFKQTYLRVSRTLYEQVLRLQPAQMQALYDYLERNYQPENRYYQYDSFRNNCSTKVRDVLINVLSADLTFPDSGLVAVESYRESIRPYLAAHPWSHLGIDLLLSMPVEHPAGHFEQMFLPYDLKNALANATIRLGTENQQLIQKTTLYPAPQIQQSILVKIFNPRLILWLALLGGVLLSAREIRTGTVFIKTDGLLFVLIGLLGCLFLLLWFGSTRIWTEVNWNILWALPTHLLAGFILLRRLSGETLRTYFTVTAGIAILFLSTWALIPQQIPGEILPVVLLIIVRSVRHTEIGVPSDSSS